MIFTITTLKKKLQNLGERSAPGISFYPAHEIFDSEWSHICTLGSYWTYAIYDKNNIPKEPQEKMLAKYALENKIANGEVDWIIVLLGTKPEHYPINRSLKMDYPSTYDLKDHKAIKKFQCKERNSALIGALKNQRIFFFISEK